MTGHGRFSKLQTLATLAAVCLQPRGLKAFVSDIEEVDEGYRNLYVEADDGTGWYLDIEDKNPYELDQKLETSKKNNRALNQRVQELQREMAKLKEGHMSDEDIEELRNKAAELDQLKNQGLLEQGKVEEYLERRTEEMRKKHKKQIEEKDEQIGTLKKRTESYYQRVRRLQIESAAQTAVNNVGTPREGAMNDILNRAFNDWEVDEDGELNPREGLIDADGEDIKSMQQWAKNLLHSAPYLFESSSGSGGASGGRRRGGGTQDDGPRLLKRGGKLTTTDIKDLASGKAVYED